MTSEPLDLIPALLERDLREMKPQLAAPLLMWKADLIGLMRAVLKGLFDEGLSEGDVEAVGAREARALHPSQDQGAIRSDPHEIGVRQTGVLAEGGAVGLEGGDQRGEALRAQLVPSIPQRVRHLLWGEISRAPRLIEELTRDRLEVFGGEGEGRSAVGCTVC